MRVFVLVVAGGLLTADVAHADNECPGHKISPNIMNLVFSLSGYNPTPAPGSMAKTPQCAGAQASQAGDVLTAFNLAPPGLKQDLCSLACIFVSSGGVNESWGQWADPKYGGDNTAVIAIDSGDVTRKLEDKMNLNLRGNSYGTHPAVVNGSSYITLMYTLAHEMAHIKWRRNLNYGSGPIGGCSSNEFLNLWSSLNNPAPANVRWTDFNNEFGSFQNSSIKHLSNVGSATDLSYIYNNGVVTALGANNPEEEFVETYAIATLIPSYNPLINPPIYININIAGQVIPVNNDRNQLQLQYKFACVWPLLQQVAAPQPGISRRSHTEFPRQRRHHNRR